MTHFVFDDGGRKDAGYKGLVGDCVVRAIAIATSKPYKEVYKELAALEKKVTGTRSARNGISKKTYNSYLINNGWTWVPTMQFGQGCKVHLNKEELPSGRLIVSLSKHVAAVINGVIHDTYDPSRNGRRCVYGYFKKLGE